MLYSQRTRTLCCSTSVLKLASSTFGPVPSLPYPRALRSISIALVSPSTTVISRSGTTRVSLPLRTQKSTSYSTYSPKSRKPPPLNADSPSRPAQFLPSRHEIYAVPFKHSPADARAFLEARAPTHAIYNSFYWSCRYQIGRLFKKWLPNPPVELLEFEAVYVPAWRVGGKVTIPFTSRKTLKVTDVTLDANDAFFPGTSEVPFSLVSSTPTILSLPEDPPTFSPALHLTQFGRLIRPIPFDLSPLAIPVLLRNLPYIDVAGHVAVDTHQAQWLDLNAVPIYLPFYVAKFDFIVAKFELMLEASQEEIVDCPFSVEYPPSPTSSVPRTRSTLRRWVYSLVTSYQTTKAPSGNQPPLFPLLTASKTFPEVEPHIPLDGGLKRALEGRKVRLKAGKSWAIGMGRGSVVNVKLEGVLDEKEGREVIRQASLGMREEDGVGRIGTW